MFILKRRANWDNRDYLDHKDRMRRRLRMRLSIGMTLLGFLLLALSLDTASVRVQAQPALPTETVPGQPATLRLPGTDEPAGWTCNGCRS